ncbi:MAG: hypothetical protein BWY59_01027 [Verrucomicrobia bacterium ADurb.Bin345]|nr:MAG: hypothetical protein BWY59_01027 [Verrucomicrobia bacterium ADurb.Bin345]
MFQLAIHGDAGHREARGKERNEFEDLVPRHAAAFPPEQQHQHRRERNRHRLAQQRRNEKHQREEVQGARAQTGRFGSQLEERDAVQEAEHIEESGERVLAFRDPRDGLHLHRVQREDRGREEGAGNLQPPQHKPQQAGVQRVQQNIYRVIARRVEAPQTVFNPEACVRHRVVLRGRPQVEPDAAQAGGGVQRRIFGHVRIVIPDITAAQRGDVGYERRGEDGEQPREKPRVGAGLCRIAIHFRLRTLAHGAHRNTSAGRQSSPLSSC